MANKKSPPSEAEMAQKTLELIQELVWAIRSREPNELLKSVSYLQQIVDNKKTEIRKIEKKPLLRDKRQYLKKLVGSMPLVLADVELFPTNEDIAKFAREALQISITRWEKRSRYELIGMLVMQSINASHERLQEVGNLLDRISEESDSMTTIKQNVRQTGFSWNEAIRSLKTSVE